MSTGTDRTTLPAELLAAHDAATLMPPITTRDAAFSMAEAFAVADRVRAARLARGERPLGCKIGFTNRSIWPLYGVHEPGDAPRGRAPERPAPAGRSLTGLLR